MGCNSLSSYFILTACASMSATLAVVAFSPFDISRVSLTPKARVFVETHSLFGISPGSSSGAPPGGSSRQKPVTARESAVLVEWERMSNLDRRVEDGVNYEHLPEIPTADSNGENRSGETDADTGDIPHYHGVFCGYKSTKEESDRLKNADPKKVYHHNNSTSYEHSEYDI